METKRELIERRKMLGQRKSNLQNTIVEKKKLFYDYSLELTEIKKIDKEISKLSPLIQESHANWNDLFEKVCSKMLPLEIKIKIDSETQKLYDKKIDVHKVDKIPFSLYSEKELDIISSKYPMAIKELNEIKDSYKKSKLKARKLIEILNTRLTPDEAKLVSEVKEFLLNF